MTRVCTICKHPKRYEIERAALAKDSLRNIAARFGVGYTAVKRHKDDGHVTAKLAQSRDMREMIQAEDLLGQAKMIQEHAVTVLEQAIAVDRSGSLKEPLLAIKALHQAREGVRLLGEVLGRLNATGAVTVNNTVVQMRVYETPSNGRDLGAGLIVHTTTGSGNGGKRSA